jgi:AP-1 complex subunit gamma-1
LEYLKVSDPEFKSDLTAKICSLVQKFSPNKQWYIDQLINVLSEPGNFVADDVLRSMVVVVSNAPELHGFSVRSLYRAMLEWSGQEGLAQVAVWCIGEYGEILVNNINELQGEEPLTVTESDAVDVIETVLKDGRTSLNTQAYALTALLKLSSRFPTNSQRIKDLIQLYKGNLTLELQQRSIEFGAILNRHENIKYVLPHHFAVDDWLSTRNFKPQEIVSAEHSIIPC